MVRDWSLVTPALSLVIVLSWGASTVSAQSGAANGKWRMICPPHKSVQIQS